MKIALVTGASTGIGRAVALELSQNQFEVFLTARDQKKLFETQSIIQEEGGKAHILIADLSNLTAINHLITTLKQQVTTLDLIANIAGVWHGADEAYADKEFQSFDQQVILDTFSVAITTPTLLVHGLLPLMPAGSSIINLSGTFENGARGWLPYYVSKRSIEDFTIGLSQELSDREIRVNCISPSDTATEAYAKFFPQYMAEAIDPKEIARKIVELIKLENNITGKVIVMKKGTEPFEAFHY